MNFIKQWMSQDILDIQAYQVQQQSNKLKLDAMESPFIMEDKIQAELLKEIKAAELNRYPISHNKLKKTIKKLMSIPDNLDVMLGNGSDELIQIIMLACKSNNTIIGFNPSFVMYEMVAKWCKLNYKSINLNSEFEIDIEKTLQIINQTQPQIIFIAYPNNPTGNNFNIEKIIKIIKNTTALVIIDEAYYAYSNHSFINLIGEFNNLIVLRTISKIGFAGLRLGIMVAEKETIIEFDKLRMPYNINTLTMISANFLLKNKNLIHKNAEIIKVQREVVFNKLNAIKEIIAYKSDANFILFKAKNSNELFDFLNKNNILIKNMQAQIEGFLRVTISTANENEEFLLVVKKFYE